MEVALLITLLLIGLGNLALGVMYLFRSRVSDPSAEFEKTANRTDTRLREEMTRSREESARNSRELREELFRTINLLSETLQKRLTESVALQTTQLTGFSDRLGKLSQSNNFELEKMRETIERKLSVLQADNNQKLEQMRATVDEKLHATLEQRLGESFKIVSDRLELVHKGLGEMQSLATGVGDLKKVLTNIKTRGTWGEVQLGNLLEQMLTPDQYSSNVQLNPLSAERVDFAIRLPGRDGTGPTTTPMWLPIDSKFPQEDYHRLVDAGDRGDAAGVLESAAALEARVAGEARKIRDKYIQSPYTTDFAILFLPTEGLFAEVLRRPGLCERIQREHRVVLSGPTTLAAVLSSLQMGFRTLVIEKRTSDVWHTLNGIKTEFSRFGVSAGKSQTETQRSQQHNGQGRRAVACGGEEAARGARHAVGRASRPQCLRRDRAVGRKNRRAAHRDITCKRKRQRQPASFRVTV